MKQNSIYFNELYALILLKLIYQFNSMNKTRELFLNINSLTNLLQKIECNQCHIKVSKKLCSFLHFEIKKSSPEDMHQLALKIKQRQIERITRKENEGTSDGICLWAAGEQKLLYWVSVCYCQLQGLDINEITCLELSPIQKIFCDKSVQNLLFEIKHTIDLQKQRKINWTSQEEKLLAKIMKQENQLEQNKTNFKWKYISFRFFILSDFKSIKNSRKCKERWANYVNPNISKTKWSKEEDIQLIHLMRLYNSKWSLISKKLKKYRTEHMTKNRANSLIKKIFPRRVKKLSENHFFKILKQLGYNTDYSSQNEYLIAEELQIHKCYKQKLENPFDDQFQKQSFKNQIFSQSKISQQCQQFYINKKIDCIYQLEMKMIEDILTLPKMKFFDKLTRSSNSSIYWNNSIDQNIEIDW